MTPCFGNIFIGFGRGVGEKFNYFSISVYYLFLFYQKVWLVYHLCRVCDVPDVRFRDFAVLARGVPAHQLSTGVHTDPAVQLLGHPDWVHDYAVL